MGDLYSKRQQSDEQFTVEEKSVRKVQQQQKQLLQLKMAPKAPTITTTITAVAAAPANNKSERKVTADVNGYFK